MATLKRYKVEMRYSQGKRIWEVVDCQSNKVEFDSLFQSKAIKKCKLLNYYHMAAPGGFNKHFNAR